jgi:saccharopine dehydrogenase (NAD+, L-lysine-forming)
LGRLEPFGCEGDMIAEVRRVLPQREKVRVLVIGALGRCGRGAVDLFRKVGLDESVFTPLLERLFIDTSPHQGKIS